MKIGQGGASASVIAGKPSRFQWSSFVLAITAGLGMALLGLPVVALVLGVPWRSVLSAISSGQVGPALALSVVTTLIATGLCLALGVPLAWWMSRLSPGPARYVRALVLLPLVLPPVAGGVALLLLFGGNGAIGQILSQFGISLPFSTAAVVLSQVFVAIPFMVLASEAAFRSVDPQQFAVARTLGASQWQQFSWVALPLAAPGIAAGALLSWARAFGEFGATVTFAGSLPGVTETLPLAVYRALESDQDEAIALAVVMLAMSAAVVLVLGVRWLPLGGFTTWDREWTSHGERTSRGTSASGGTSSSSEEGNENRNHRRTQVATPGVGDSSVPSPVLEPSPDGEMSEGEMSEGAGDESPRLRTEQQFEAGGVPGQVVTNPDGVGSQVQDPTERERVSPENLNRPKEGAVDSVDRVDSVDYVEGGSAQAPGLSARVQVARPEFLVDVSLGVAPGEIVVVAGSNGAGKSTLLLAIAGLQQSQETTVSVGSAQWDHEGSHVRVEDRGVGWVPQNGQLFEHLSVVDNVAFGLRCQGESRSSARESASEILAAHGFAALGQRRAVTLSGGQARRVAVLRAVAPGPSVLLLDEPMNGLDDRARIELMEWLRSWLARFPKPTIVVTHDQDVARALGARRIRMDRGQVVASESAKENHASQ